MFGQKFNWLPPNALARPDQMSLQALLGPLPDVLHPCTNGSQPVFTKKTTRTNVRVNYTKWGQVGFGELCCSVSVCTGLWWELYFFPGVAVFQHCSVVTVPASSSQRTHSQYLVLPVVNTELPVVNTELNQNFEIWYKTSMLRHFWKLIPTETWPRRPLLSAVWLSPLGSCAHKLQTYCCAMWWGPGYFDSSLREITSSCDHFSD